MDGEGFTLYIFTNTPRCTSTCYDDCAANWPVVPGDNRRGRSRCFLFGTTARVDGTEQLTDQWIAGLQLTWTKPRVM